LISEDRRPTENPKNPRQEGLEGLQASRGALENEVFSTSFETLIRWLGARIALR